MSILLESMHILFRFQIILHIWTFYRFTFSERVYAHASVHMHGSAQARSAQARSLRSAQARSAQARSPRSAQARSAQARSPRSAQARSAQARYTPALYFICYISSLGDVIKGRRVLDVSGDHQGVLVENIYYRSTTLKSYPKILLFYSNSYYISFFKTHYIRGLFPVFRYIDIKPNANSLIIKQSTILCTL